MFRAAARVFGAVERCLLPDELLSGNWSQDLECEMRADGGRDQQTTRQQPWLVAHDDQCERWDGDRDYARSELRVVPQEGGALVVHKDHVNAVEHLDAAAARVTPGGCAADYVDSFPMIRVGEDSLVNLSEVVASDDVLAGINEGGRR